MTTVSHPALELSRPFAKLSHRLSGWLDSRSAPTRQLAATSISLFAREIHRVTSFRGGCVECTEGCVWLTHDGDCRDVLLEAGQSHFADRDSPLLIYAMASSALRLVPPVALSQ
jgi:DUF2917 family protein